MRKIILIIIAAIVAGGAVSVVLIYPKYQNPKNDLIRVASPKPNALVSSPLEVTGQARGNWFFEASFPVFIYDSNGKELGVVPAQAQSDWMTTDFIPFRAILEFEIPKTKEGVLVLKKDNPSGLPANDDELRIPVRFNPVETIKVKAYFNNSIMDPEISCSKVFPIEREIPKTQAVAMAALEELLKGPTDLEKGQGFFTSINTGVKIQKLTIENKVAKVDFDEQLEFQVGGSCRVSAIRAQITQTLKQFSTVDSATISINGRTEDILQP
ncbi:MAG: GerMN domain-containing protein [bacterium]|nr:GerMN domain-containing protein [bacterium]